MNVSKILTEYDLGSVVAVPISKSESVLSVAMRRNENGKRAREAFFGVTGSAVPTKELLRLDAGKIEYSDLRMFMLCSDLSVRTGAWPIVGSIKPFNFDKWFIPPAAPRLHGDTDEELLEDGLYVGLIHDNCADSSKYRGAKWISLEEHKQLPLETGVGDAEALRVGAIDLMKKREKSVYWCCPTPARIKKWKWLREQILAADAAKSQS